MNKELKNLLRHWDRGWAFGGGGGRQEGRPPSSL